MIEFYAYVLVKRQLYVQFSEYGCGCILKEKPEYDYESLITKGPHYKLWKNKSCFHFSF